MISFKDWLKLREDFHQGTGALGASLPINVNRKRKIRKQLLTPYPIMKIDVGQGVQGTKRDDGNG